MDPNSTPFKVESVYGPSHFGWPIAQPELLGRATSWKVAVQSGKRVNLDVPPPLSIEHLL